MSRLLGIGALQMSTAQGAIDKNLLAVEHHVKAMMSRNPMIKMVCTNELCFQGPLDMEKTAQTIPGQITDVCCDIAKKHKIYFIAGSIYEKSGRRYYNTTPIISPDGDIIARYQKMFPWRPQEETDSGNDTVVFDIPKIGTVGICICYDLWFPEVIRDLVWKGAELIVIPTLSGTQDRNQEIILARAAAISNQCHILSINGAMPQGLGKSLLIDPEGHILQKTGQGYENIMAMIDLEQASNIRRYGTVGVSYPMASFMLEGHRFSYQEPGAQPSECLKKLKTMLDAQMSRKKISDERR